MTGLAGRVALITGGHGLIGKALVERFAAEGARVVCASRQSSKRGHEGSADVLHMDMDLADERSIRAAFESVCASVGAPEILIAGASRREGLATAFDEISHEDFTRLFEVDAAGHFLCARLLEEHLPRSGKGSVVFLSSIYAVHGVDLSIYPPGMPPTPPQYSAVKAGVLGLTRHLAARWGSRGIRVNAVIAGGVEAGQPVEFQPNYARKTLLGRMARPQEIAGAVAFLASEEASYITGECLVVDGGFA